MKIELQDSETQSVAAPEQTNAPAWAQSQNNNRAAEVPAVFASSFAPPEDTGPSNGSTMLASSGSDEPVPVVKVLSVRGVEYLFMSIFLWLAAGSFTGLLLSVINGSTGFASLAFPLSMMLVTFPGFAVMFLRLKKAELANPRLRLDPSKRRLTQITQVLAFLTCLINVITFIYLVLQKIGGEGELAAGKAIINMLIILAVAGGILAYYWFDEHKQER